MLGYDFADCEAAQSAGIFRDEILIQPKTASIENMCTPSQTFTKREQTRNEPGLLIGFGRQSECVTLLQISYMWDIILIHVG